MHDRDWYRAMWRSLNAAGHWQGEVWNRRKNGELYPEWLTISAVTNEAGETTNYVGLFTDISRLKHSEAQLDYLAHTDPLTGLPNRLLLTSRLEHAIERARAAATQVAVLFIDLDRFTLVNDSLGFEAGDEALKAVADQLRDELGPAITLGRLGADEFIAILEDLPAPEPAERRARQLLGLLDRDTHLPSGASVRPRASIGISLYPDDGATANQLIPQAGAAAAEAKQAGGATVRFHTAAMAQAAQTRFALETDLRRAIEQQTLTLHYQPRFDLATGRIDGAEALLRWPRRSGELTMPGAFIGLAETTGLIIPLGEWVLEQAARQMRQWLDAGLPIATVAVNVSARQIRQPDFVSRVEALLADTGLPPRALELEITESVVLECGAEILAGLGRLRTHGIQLALDDFGTGYSSFSTLHRLPLDTIKIDRSFLERLPDDRTARGVVRAMVTMASHLDLRTVAEGVETEAQQRFLIDCGCQLAQGYLLGRPEPAAALDARLRSGAR